MKLDHVVLWVDDPLRAVSFYTELLGLTPVRLEEFREGKVPFPSVRISDETILDLMSKQMAPFLNGMATGTPGASAAGNLVNHVCLAMSQGEYEALDAKLREAGVDTSHRMSTTFGARGHAPHAFYFQDPDGNVLEARYYES